MNQTSLNLRYDNVTFMFCMPRSRSAWMCEFLRAGCSQTHHDPMKNCASVDELGEMIDQALFLNRELPIFIADTSLVLAYDQVIKRFPGARYLVVARDPGAVISSLARHGRGMEPHLFTAYLDAMENAIYALKAAGAMCLLLRYEMIDARLDTIWRGVCGNKLLDPTYAQEIVRANIQVPFADQSRMCDPAKNAQFLRSLKL